MLKKHAINSLIVLLAVFVFVGALSLNVLAQEDDRQGGSISVPYEDVSLPRMDPHYAETIGSQNVGLFIAEPLLFFTGGEYTPVLAEDWEVSEDSSTYKIFVQEDVLFHNGKILTAEDIKANFERIIDESLVQAGNLAGVESLNVIDDYTLEINLRDSDPFFLSKVQEVVIVDPDSWVDLGQDDGVIGTGPFQYDVDTFRAEAGQTLTRFDDYWRGTPNLEEVKIIITGGRDASRIQLERGELQIAPFADFSAADKLEEAGMQVYPFGRINWARIVFNLQNVDLPIRKAINYAFNPEPVLNSPAIFAGFGELQNTIAYPDTDFYLPDLGYDYDLDRAREILDEAGWVDPGDGVREKDGEKLVLNFPTREGMGWSQATQMIQSMLRQVGIDSEITIQPSSTFYTNVRTGEYDLAWWLTNAPPEPSVATETFDAREHWSVTQAVIDEMQETLEAAEATVDDEERAELFAELQEQHYEYAVSALGIWMEQVHVVRPELHGFKTTSLGHFYNVDEWYLED